MKKLFTFILFCSAPLFSNAEPRLIILPTQEFDWIYDDSGTRSKHNVSIWRPKRPAHLSNNFYSLGDIAMDSHDRRPKNAWMVAAINPSDLAPPTGYEKIWVDRGSGGSHDVTLWHAIAPQNYICLGDVAMPSYEQTPSTDLIRCVHQDLVMDASGLVKIWDDTGSGARQDVSLWETSKVGHSDGLNPNTLLAIRRHDNHGVRGYLLRMPAIANLSSSSQVQNYAPNIFLHSDEQFFPSDVNFHLSNTENYDNYLSAPLSCANCADAPFLRGKNPTQQVVPMYAFISPKISPENFPHSVLDLIFFQFYPYNRGKLIDPVLWDKTFYGDHVGDWEHYTVRFLDNFPSQIYLAEHSSGQTFEWGTKEVALNDQLRPTIYSAKGSHALYPQPGEHMYHKVEVVKVTVVKLIDEMNQGTLWDGSQNLEVLPVLAPGSYREGHQVWMNYRGRWGNKEAACIKTIGVCRLEDGPEGPSLKGYLYPQHFPLD